LHNKNVLTGENFRSIQLKSEVIAKCAERKLNHLLHFHMQPTFPFLLSHLQKKTKGGELKNGTRPALHNRIVTVIKNNNHYILALIFVPGKKLAPLCDYMHNSGARACAESLFSSIL
jgi:hypothetical protein